jgi:hypothetical protein
LKIIETNITKYVKNIKENTMLGNEKPKNLGTFSLILYKKIVYIKYIFSKKVYKEKIYTYYIKTK